MRRFSGPLLAALALTGAAPAALAEGVQSAPPPIPPALQVLEQKLAQIHFNTARISDRLVLGEASVPVGTAELGSGLDQCKGAEVTTTGVFRHSPFESATTDIFAGYRSREIEIGATTYRYERSIAKYDGGRPWIRRRKAATKPERGSANDTDPSTLTVLGAVFSSSRPRGSQGPFARLVEDLDGALSIQEIGPATVDRQQVTEYIASLSAAKLLAGRLNQKQHQMARELEAEPVTLELFIAPSGLPVRTTVVVATGKEGLGEEEDFRAVGIPVSIHAPPPRATIGQAKLDQLQKRRRKAGIFEKLTIGEPTSSTPHCPEEAGGGLVGVRRPEPG
jgi:hypothetical protein